MSIKKIQFSPIKEQRMQHQQTARRDYGEEREEEEDVDFDENNEIVTVEEDAQEFIPNTDLTVKFQITETQIIAHSYKRTFSLREIKRDIAAKFKVPDNLLALYHHHQQQEVVVVDEQQQHQPTIVNEASKLNDLPRNQFGIVELELRVKEKGREHSFTPPKLDLNVYYSNFTLPEIITVNVPHPDDGHGRKIIVEIDNRQIVKPFLGGYRDPVTKTEYHNASTQTGPLKVFRRPILTRETQTEPHLIRSIKTTRTPRNEIREFVSSDEMLVRLHKAKSAAVIQRNFRAFKWRQLIRESAEQWRTMQQRAKERMNYETANADYNQVLRLLYMAPTEKEDFDQIHAAIQHWKREEKLRLKTLHSDGSYIAELNLVVEKEIYLLNEVEQRKGVVKALLREKASERMLRRLGRPKKFISRRDNETVLEMDTLGSQKIRYWTDLYNKLKSPAAEMNKQQRLELLDNVLESLQKEPYPKRNDLQELLERERNLWEMNFTARDMDTLRERQLLILLDLIQVISKRNDSESFYPGEDNDNINNNTKRICGKCKNLLPEDRLVLLGRKDIADICKRCDSLHRANNDENIYREILRAIRRDERKYGALQSFAFIIQEQDIQYLVETVWHGHSIISQTTDRRRLRLPRYIRTEDWSPWNCILLTETEAKTHLKLHDLAAVYQKHLLQVIASRNNLALTAFRRLQGINYEFVESGQWWSEDPFEANVGPSSSSSSPPHHQPLGGRSN